MQITIEKTKKKSKIKKTKTKSEFGKTMYLFNVIFVSYVVTISFILISLSGKLGITDLSAISTIVMSAFAELGIHTGFIVWKAKVENCRKYPNVNQTDISLANNDVILEDTGENSTQNNEYNTQNNRGTSLERNNMATKIYGIDLSKHNTTTSFQAIKNSGKSFVFIRLGWANSNGTITIDNDFQKNYQGALAVGLEIGVYLYSYLKDVSYAKIAAQNTIKLIKDLTITYPVAFDYEEHKIAKLLTKAQNTEICKVYLTEVQSLGYFAMIYTYTSFVNEYLNISDLSGFAMWIADYKEQTGTTCPYKGAWGIWQYSGSGTCKGVTGACDLNISKVDYASIIKAKKLNNYKGKTNTVNSSTVITTNVSNSTTLSTKYLVDYTVEQPSKVITYDYITQGNLYLSPHFKAKEFRCPTTNTILIDNRLIWLLEKLYTDLELSKCIITSGYRTPTYSVSVGGCSADKHTTGQACDIICHNKECKIINSKLVCCKLCDYGNVFGIGYIWANTTHFDTRLKSQIWFGDETNGKSLIKLGFSNFYEYWNIGVSKTVKDGVWNVRKLPSTSGEIITTIKIGEKYTTTKAISGWSYIPNLSGWVSNKAFV